MTKDELEMTLNEIKTHREILLSALNELKKAEPDPKNSEEADENLKESEEEPELMKFDFNKIIYDAITTGKIKRVLEKIIGGMDLTKTALKSLCDIVDKTRDKLEGKIKGVSGTEGIPIMTDMLLPMFISLIQTQEFQHLMSNMIAQLFKES